MRIGILSFRPQDMPFAAETERLREAAELKGHEVHVFRVEDCQLGL